MVGPGEEREGERGKRGSRGEGEEKEGARGGRKENSKKCPTTKKTCPKPVRTQEDNDNNLPVTVPTH